jgi:hypothetical protein
VDGVVEIITGRERRRRWSLRDKLSLVAETHEPGATIRGVAARHGVCESLLFTWRRQVREGVLTAAPEMRKRRERRFWSRAAFLILVDRVWCSGVRAAGGVAVLPGASDRRR